MVRTVENATELVETAGGEIPLVYPGSGGEWNPRGKYTRLVLKIQDILSDGRRRDMRSVYYALEAQGDPYDYDEVKKAVKRGRRAGFIDPNQIVDDSRAAAVTPTGYEDPETFLDEAVDGIWNRYDEDFWTEQDHYVEVWLEKRGLTWVFSDICRDLNVRLEPTRGDWSDSKVFEATQRLIGKLNEGKKVRILYFGDFNPSGFHAPVAVQATMGHYGLKFRDKVSSDHSHYFEIWPMERPLDDPDEPGANLMFERVALNLDHIKKWDFPENPAPSKSDKDRKIRDRFMEEVSEGRDTNVELNALAENEREALEDMVRESIQNYVDEDAREEVEERVRDDRERLEQAIEIDRDAL